MDVVNKGVNIIKDGIAWADEVTDKMANVEEVKALLSWVQDQSSLLVKYTGDMLTTSLVGLSTNANELMKSMQEVYFLAKSVKSKASDTRDYIQWQDDLADGGNATPNEDQMELWHITLETLIDCLDTSYERTKEIRLGLEAIQDDLVKL